MTRQEGGHSAERRVCRPHRGNETNSFLRAASLECLLLHGKTSMRRIDVAEGIAAAARAAQRNGNHRLAAKLFGKALRVLQSQDIETIPESTLRWCKNAWGDILPRAPASNVNFQAVERLPQNEPRGELLLGGRPDGADAE